MTINEIQKALRAAGVKRNISRVRVYVKMFGIPYLGIRQRPQHYAENAPEIILARLGRNGKQEVAA